MRDGGIQMDPRRGRLAKYAKTEEGRKTHSLTTKVTEQEYREFTELAARLKLTPSEALRKLIIDELNEVYGRIHSDPRRSALDTMRYISVSLDTEQKPADTPQIQTVNPQTHMDTKVNKSISEHTSVGSHQVKRTSGKRWTIEPYLIDPKQYICPVCNKPQHRTNASRHAKEHGFRTSQEMFEATKKPDQYDG